MPKPKPILRPHVDLRLEDWQARPGLVSAARRILADPNMQLMLAVLRNESPVNFGLPALGVATSDRLVHQAKTEGYHLALNNLEALGAVTKADVPIPATFEPDPGQASSPADIETTPL